MPRLQLIAVDTNVLLNLANRDEIVVDCIETIKGRLAAVSQADTVKNLRPKSLIQLENRFAFSPELCGNTDRQAAHQKS